MATDHGEYAANEKVLCFHKGIIYEAKVLEAEKKDNEWNYWIHYSGWSKNWDEYVHESCVLKYNEENLLKQKEFKMDLNSRKSGIKTSLGKTSDPPKRGKLVGSSLGGKLTNSGNVSASQPHPSPPVSGKKSEEYEPAKPKEKEAPRNSSTPFTVSNNSHDTARRGNVNTEPDKPADSEGARSTPVLEEEPVAKLVVDIPMPERFKSFLVDDWHAVTNQKKLYNLPARKSVDRILDEFLVFRVQEDAGTQEFVDGVREYFNNMIGSQLLYHFERQQYEQMLRKIKAKRTSDESAAESVKLSGIYGCPHLLRLLTSFGRCETFTTVGDDCIEIFKQYIIHFLEYITLNFEEHLSMRDYGISSPEYQRKASV